MFNITINYINKIKMHTRFNKISEITNSDKKEKYSEYTELNKIIERDWVTKNQISKAYLDVILWETPILEYNELHFQIKYLLEDIKVWCNTILWFYDYKTSTKSLENKDSIEIIQNDPNIPTDIKEFIVSFLEDEISNNQITLVAHDLTDSNNIIEFILNKNKHSSKDIYNTIINWYKKLSEWIYVAWIR